MNKAVHLVNTDLVNNLANLVSRSTAKTMNPKQRYPSFDLEVMEHVLKGSGEKFVLALNELAGGLFWIWFIGQTILNVFRPSRWPLRQNAFPPWIRGVGQRNQECKRFLPVTSTLANVRRTRQTDCFVHCLWDHSNSQLVAATYCAWLRGPNT